jgi:Fe-Mn family superoxide dismutase
MNRRQVLRSLVVGAASIPLVKSDALAGLTADATVPTGAPVAAPAPAAPAPTGPFTLPALPYAYDALEPHLDAQTMQIHHDKHHAAYVANLNKAVAGHPDLASAPVERLLRDLGKVPDDIRTAVRNQGGGHANHTLLWASLKKDAAHAPSGELAKAIDAAFGSFSAFGEQWTKAALGVFGSGWAWLSMAPDGAVRIEASPNQDSPLTAGRVPLAGIDVWEHAYYLKYQNKRADYVAAFQNVVDWDAVSARYRDARKG